jgi:uncharacterized protein YdaU (DUF1376 family)
VNYWERHIGDYARDAGHLSMLEHGAYTLLLDRYYSTEAPIPADQAYRVCRARSKDERAAVDAVLAEFFELHQGDWINGRASRELVKAGARIEAARSNGVKGGRPKTNPTGTHRKPTGLLPGSDPLTQQKAHHTPDTIHQTHTHTPPEHLREPPAQPTDAGRVCLLMRRAGLQDGNPGHPDLLALIAAGATDAEFEGAAVGAAAKAKGFAYALGTLKRQREEAAALRLHTGPMPGKPAAALTVPYVESEAAKAARLERESHKPEPPSDEARQRLAATRQAARARAFVPQMVAGQDG